MEKDVDREELFFKKQIKRKSKRESKNEKKTSSFFGERPPDEMIVDQLEEFFPAIDMKDRSNLENSSNLKSIVLANLDNKRTSRRVSSIMLRRQTRRFSSMSNIDVEKESGADNVIKENVVREQSIVASSARPLIGNIRRKTQDPIIDIREKISVKKDKTLTKDETPRPILFKWTPGRLIGQGAFGKVFHALNLDTGEFMAVKQVITGQDNTQKKKSTDSLIREIELLSDLDHDNIVRYHGTRTNSDISLIL
jgi:hypothetical protein